MPQKERLKMEEKSVAPPRKNTPQEKKKMEMPKSAKIRTEIEKWCCNNNFAIIVIDCSINFTMNKQMDR